MLQPQLLPAWLSGVAAIVALCISVWAVARTGAVERRRDILQARGIAVAVYPEILKLPTTIQQAREYLKAAASSNPGFAGQMIAASLQAASTIALPSMLERNIDRLFLLGDTAGPACLQLVAIIEQHNDLAADIASRAVMMRPEQWPEAYGHLRDSLDLLAAVIAKCEHELAPIHDSIKG